MFRRISFSGILVGILALLAACGAPGEQAAAPSSEVGQQAGFETPEQAADLMLEGWAQQAAIPYRNTRYEVLSSDGAFAEVGITAEIREGADQAWVANHAVVECRNINTNWQCVGAIDFKAVSPAITSVSTKQATTSSAITRTVAPAVIDGQGVETISEEKSLAEMLVGEWWSFEEGEDWKYEERLVFLPDWRSIDGLEGDICPYHVIEEERRVTIACEDWPEEYFIVEASDSSFRLAYSDDAAEAFTFERVPHVNIDIQQLDGVWEIDWADVDLGSNSSFAEYFFFDTRKQIVSFGGRGDSYELVLGDTLLVLFESDPDIRGMLIQIKNLDNNSMQIAYPDGMALEATKMHENQALARKMVGSWGENSADEADPLQFMSDGTVRFTSWGEVSMGEYRVFGNVVVFYLSDEEPSDAYGMLRVEMPNPDALYLWGGWSDDSKDEPLSRLSQE
jgi:hypothetical protein